MLLLLASAVLLLGGRAAAPRARERAAALCRQGVLRGGRVAAQRRGGHGQLPDRRPGAVAPPRPRGPGG